MLCVIPMLGMLPQRSHALSWDELWSNSDQQGYAALAEQKPAEAAELFDNSDWKATALYRAGNYTEAAKEFAKNPSAQGHYNRGNALAKAGQLDEAIKAYNQALQQDPNLEDAKKNRNLLEQLKKQQQNQEQNQDSNDQQKSDQEKSEQQKNDQKGSNSNQQQDQQQGQQSSADNQQSTDQQQSDQQQNQENSDQQEQNQNTKNGQESSSNPEQNPGEESMNEQSSSAAGQTGATTSEGQSSENNNKQQAQTSSAAGQEQQATEEALANQVPDDGLTEEQRQAMEQWLRRVPDEPGLLLKNKFRDQYQKRRMQEYNGKWQAPDNSADERW
jgi:Ca-activated chloride channel family protein